MSESADADKTPLGPRSWFSRHHWVRNRASEWAKDRRMSHSLHQENFDGGHTREVRPFKLGRQCCWADKGHHWRVISLQSTKLMPESVILKGIHLVLWLTSRALSTLNCLSGSSFDSSIFISRTTSENVWRLRVIEGGLMPVA